MTAKEKEVAEEYSNALDDLNINSKPLINMLTMLADENSAFAPIIVQCIERQLHKVQADSKLPVLYLIDSVIKNIGQPYIPLFVKNIEKIFASTFIQVNEKTRANMFKLRSTWYDVISPTKLHALDVAIHAIDKNWPISAAAPNNIHVNPKFLNNVNHTETPKPVQPTLAIEVDDVSLREKFIEKQKELLELQQKKIELELLHTKTQIEMQKKKTLNKINLSKNTLNAASTSSSNTSVSPSTKELYSKINALSDNPRRIVEDPIKNVDVSANYSESVTLPIKMNVPSSKKCQPTSLPPIHQTLKSASQPFVSQQQHTQMVSNPLFNVNQQIPKINPVSTQLLQTLNRDPRLRKVENVVKTSPMLNEDLKQSILKNKEDKKFDRLKRNSIKHRDSKRKKSPSCSPSKKEPSRKSHKKTDRKERSPRDEKYHKRRDEKKPKEKPEVKKKNIPLIMKVPQNEIVTINCKNPLQEDKNLILEESKNDKFGKDHHVIEAVDTVVLEDKDMAIEEVHDVEINSSAIMTSELPKTDSPLEDSDSLKRLHMYMQTMKKSPEPSTTSSLEMKNDLDIRAVKSNQNTIITPQNDIDLRVIASPVKRTSDSIKADDIEPAAKKSKSEIIDELFGAEDVDLRTLTAPPIVLTPPPPPQISEIPNTDVGKSWAKYKEIKPDTFKTPYKSPTKKIPSELKETLVDNDTMDVDMRAKPTQNNKSHILRQAEEALNAGSISFDEYKKIMCQVIEMTEVEKLEEANNIEDNNTKLKEYTIPKITQPVNGNGTDSQSNLEAIVNVENSPVTDNFLGPGPWNINKKPSDVSGSDSDCSSKSGSTGSEESKLNNKKSDSEERSMFKRRKTFKRNEKENSKTRSWRNNKNWNSRSENGSRFSQNRAEQWSRGPRPNYSHSTRSLVPPPLYEVPRPTAPFASSSPDWTVPVIPPSDPVILEMIAHDATQTINIDGVSREVRFYGPTAITFHAWDDPREIYFQGPPKNVIFDDLFSVLCHFNAPDREFLLDCQPHRVRLGAPTRELYLDGQFYECFFGGPPIFTDLGGVKRSVKLEGPPPSVNIGTTKRQDLVAGQIAITVDNTYTVPVYLDAKPQRIDVGNTALILRFIDGLMRAMINDQPFKVNYNGPPQAIIVRGNKHFLRFTGLPSNIRPGYANISQMMGVVLTEDTTTEPLPSISAPPIPPPFAGFDMTALTPIEDASQSPAQSFTSTYSLAPTSTSVPLLPNTPILEPVANSYIPPAAPTAAVPPVLPSNMDINELFKKLVDSGIVPQDKPKEIIQPKIKKKEKEADNLTVKPVDFSDPSSLKQKQPGLIHNLYTGIQCSSCGIRFTAEFTIKYSSHLDWHFRQNRREKMASKTVQSRKWFYDTSDWCKYEEQEDEATRAASWFDLQAEQGTKNDEKVEEDNVPCVPAGENSELAACYLCHDQFEQFYNEKDEEWQLKNCIEKDKRLYHPICFEDMIKSGEEKLCKKNEAVEEANKRLENQKMEVLEEQQVELQLSEDIKIKEEEVEQKCELGTVTENEIIKVQEIITEKDTSLEKEIITKTEISSGEEVNTENKILTDKEIIAEEETIKVEELIIKKENEEQITGDNLLETLKSVSEETLIEDNVSIIMLNDLEIPDSTEIVQVTEVLSPPLIDEPVIEDNNMSSPPNTQDNNISSPPNTQDINISSPPNTQDNNISSPPNTLDNNISSPPNSQDNNVSYPPNTPDIVPEEIKPRSPSPVSTMTCSIDGNTDTEWNVPVAPAMGTIKININQKSTPVNKSISHNEASTEPQSPLDFTQTFGEIDPDQPPPPGLEMETVVAPKILREMKPRLMHNSQKLKEYPLVNRGKEMSGLCSIM